MVVDFQNACHAHALRARAGGGGAVRPGAGRRRRGGARLPAVRAAAELYIGCVEVGVGLIPAGGGCMEMAARASARATDDPQFDILSLVRGPFLALATARVSTSAEEARDIGYLRQGDSVSMARETADRRRQADRARPGPRRLPPAAAAPHPRHRRGGPGDPASRRCINLLGAHQITAHDAKVAGHLARVLSGGAVPPGATVSEQHILDLEREGVPLAVRGTEDPRAHPIHAAEEQALRN